MQNIKTAFFGTPQFVTHVLDALLAADLLPQTIVTQPDRPAGRGLLPRPAAVKLWGDAHQISVLQPEKIDTSFADALSGYDLFIVAGFGRLLPKELLDIPKHGTLNVHPSLLPLFRGPSPIESQILSDTKTVGVSVILLDEETDHGPILAQKSFTPNMWPIMRSDLEDLLWSEGGKLLAASVPSYIDGALTPKAQDHQKATFTPKLSKDDGLLNLSENAYENYLKYCAYEGWPGTYFFTEREGKKTRIKIVKAEYASGEMKILRVIPEGKKEISYEDFLRNVTTSGF